MATAIAAALAALPVSAQIAPSRDALVPVQTYDDALVQDARAVADRLQLSLVEAERHLRLQEASVAVTDAISARYAGRIAGISLEHRPEFRIVVRLTGNEAVPDEVASIGSEDVRIRYVPGARATLTELIQAISTHQAALRGSLLAPPGLGVDQRTAELVAVVSARDVAREGEQALRNRIAALTRVPVRLRVLDDAALDLSSIAGGARMIGSVPGDQHRYLCTAGFVVTDGTQTGLATAAHCPDALNARGADGNEIALPFAGQWGWGHQDVQINAVPDTLQPVFFADTAKTIVRPVTGSRARAATRAGDIVCHRGERTGYSCAEVELTDFAPAGDLCGGPCLPTWTTVAGPGCKGGDSGSPVFLGTTAFGILKGGSYRSDRSCAFYFYMSTDYLPTGWRLLTATAPAEDHVGNPSDRSAEDARNPERAL
jgi:streptogrisin C